MSICRWSSDNYQCDVYVWGDVAGGYRTEVAGRRRVFAKPTPPPVLLPIGAPNSPERTAWAEAWCDRQRALEALLDDETTTWLDLPEPSGGNSYWDDTAAQCADTLEMLRAEGFNVPQYAIDSLRDDHREPDREETNA